MKYLFQLNNQKKGMSEVVGYVLLIVIVIALSILIYGWLRFYVTAEDIPACSDDVNVVLKNQKCSFSGGDIILNITLKNKGFFDVDGYVLRVHDRAGAKMGLYPLDMFGFPLAPNEERSVAYNVSNYSFDGYVLGDLTLVEVQPFTKGDDENISCRISVLQNTQCAVSSDCGNGIVEDGEACDEGAFNGGGVDNDGDSYDCSSSCQFVIFNNYDSGCFVCLHESLVASPPMYNITRVSFAVGASCPDPYCYVPTSSAQANTRCTQSKCEVVFYTHEVYVNFTTPYIDDPGIYNLTWEMNLSGPDVGTAACEALVASGSYEQCNESYAVKCGGVTTPFIDKNLDDANTNVVNSVQCDFSSSGYQEIIFTTIPESGEGESIHLKKIKLEGPII